jgi:hypothetical protein
MHMYATIRTYSGATDLVAELVRNEGAVKDLIAGVPGARAYYLIATADGAVSVSVCDDLAGTERSNTVAAAWIRDNLPNLSVSPPTISGGEVAISFAV